MRCGCFLFHLHLYVYKRVKLEKLDKLHYGTDSVVWKVCHATMERPHGAASYANLRVV